MTRDINGTFKFSVHEHGIGAWTFSLEVVGFLT